MVQRAERTISVEAEPGTAPVLHTSRGVLEAVRGQDADALAAFRSAERVAGHLAAPHALVPPTRALRLLGRSAGGPSRQVPSRPRQPRVQPRWANIRLESAHALYGIMQMRVICSGTGLAE